MLTYSLSLPKRTTKASIPDVVRSIIFDNYYYLGAKGVKKVLAEKGFSYTEKNIQCIAFKLKVKSSIQSQGNNATTYNPNWIPPNKGKKMSKSTYEKVKNSGTWFKKGQIPHTAREEGHISCRLDKNGNCYMYYHFGAVGKRNTPYHTYAWKQKHGKLAEDEIVIYKESSKHIWFHSKNEILKKMADTKDFTRLQGLTIDMLCEHLEVITRKENALRNSGCREVTDAFVLKNLARDKELREKIRTYYPEIIDIKRQQIFLNRAIRAQNAV